MTYKQINKQTNKTKQIKLKKQTHKNKNKQKTINPKSIKRTLKKQNKTNENKQKKQNTLIHIHWYLYLWH